MICPNLFDGGQPLPIDLQGLCPQSSISCRAELLPARHLICVSKRFFGCQICASDFVKPHVFAVSRTDLLSSSEPKQCCYPECHFGKGAQKGAFFPQCLLAQRTRCWTVNKREFQLWDRGCCLRSFWWRHGWEKCCPPRIPKSHCSINLVMSRLPCRRICPWLQQNESCTSVSKKCEWNQEDKVCARFWVHKSCSSFASFRLLASNCCPHWDRFLFRAVVCGDVPTPVAKTLSIDFLRVYVSFNMPSLKDEIYNQWY